MSRFPVSALVIVLLVGAAAPLCAQRVTLERERIDTTVAFSPSGTVELEIAAGEIRVTAWARNEVQIAASAEGGTIAAVLTPNRIELDARVRRSGVRGSTRYTLSVPVGVAVVASAASGAIVVSGTRSNLQLETLTGTIEASDASGRIDVEATSGRLVLQRLSGTINVGTISGTVALYDIAGNLEIETTSGRVQVERGAVSRFAFESVAGSLDYGGTLTQPGPHRIETHSGTVTLRLPADFAATIDLETFRGEFRPLGFSVVAFPGGGRGRDRDRLRFAVNGGGVSLSITTFTGDVFIRRLANSPDR